MYEARRVLLEPAACGLDLGDGSERAEYVNQDYILNKLGRPHRNIGIMYTYYPKDREWPQRISEACRDMEIHFQWDYPYDDYFPYLGGIGGSTEGEPFTMMRDIRRHGQDVALTLTIDCSLPEEYLRQIARELRPYGRMRLRINHECTGDWFTHNRRFSYQEVADFFVRFAKIVKEEAPNVTIVFCGGAVRDAEAEDSEVEYEQEFRDAFDVADVWSNDCYLALHYGWPFDVCEKGGDSYTVTPVEPFLERLRKTSKRMTKVNGGICKPFVISEFNTDGDVTGPRHQGESVKQFVQKLKEENADWFDGFSMYQFRDRGRLGLEREDPNNPAVGIEQPILKDYQEILKDSFFQPVMTAKEQVSYPVSMRWGGSEDAEGLALSIVLEKTPEFFEVSFAEPLNLMIEINGRWFYKSPEVETIDLMPAFFDSTIEPGSKVTLHLFAPPESGQNEPEQGEDWAVNYYTRITEEPEFRIRYEEIERI